MFFLFYMIGMLNRFYLSYLTAGNVKKNNFFTMIMFILVHVKLITQINIKGTDSILLENLID